MTWLAIVVLLECGIVPTGPIIPGQNEGTYYIDGQVLRYPVYLSIGVDATLWGFIFIRGSAVNYGYIQNFRLGVVPYYINYSVSAGIAYNNFEMGFRHFCNHPINCNVGTEKRCPAYTVNYSREEIYLQVKIKGEW
jgi:hypothetical protein